MNKFIKVMAILSIVSAIIDFTLGRLIIPFIYLLINGRGMYSGNSALSAMITFFGLRIFDLIGVIVIILFAVLVLIGINLKRETIGVEVTGLILTGISPLASVIISFTSVGLIRLITQSTGIAFYGTYSVLNSAGSFGGFLHGVTVVLIVIALTASLCRIKWSRDDEFDRD